MSRLLCCRRARHADMGAALSQPQEGDACEGAGLPAAPPTMADVIRERKKKAGGAGLGTLRRRIAAAARRPRDNRPDRGCEHARYIRSVVRGWRVGEVVVVLEALEAGAALRDLVTQAELAREPAPALHADLARASAERLCCDVELHGKGFSLHAHRALLAARSTYFRDLLARHPTGSGRVPLEGVGAGLSREELEAVVGALYAGTSLCARRPLCDMCVAAKWERGGNAEVDLDIINVENTGTCRSLSRCVCGRSRVNAAAARRLAEPLGYSLDTLHHDMRYLLDSGEYADARLSFRVEGGAQYGFRTALELPCHRVVLAARSRFFRSVMCRRGAGAGGGGAVCVDEKVLPRRFARALLHAAYTDQVDLSLIGRCTSSPSSTNSTGSGNTSWPGVARGNSSSRPTTTAMLDDAFQLYEIARFLEMPIVVQGCEDAIVEALSAETLPHVLRWSSAPHASQWVHRQAMRYLRDEFPAIMSSAASSRLPRSALAGALASPFLQASEPSALRALLRWAERAVANQDQHSREPNVVWHTAHSAARRGGRRRDLSEQALREALQPLVAHVRLEHMPPDHDLLQQVIRRGLIPQPPQHMVEGGSTADAWLGKGAARPPRCFLPYLDEIKALVEHQTVAECEVMAARRGRYVHRIPDTLYMVAAGAGEGAGPVAGAGPGPGAGPGAEGACVSPRVLAALRARVRRLRAAPNAVRALALHATDPRPVQTQIALRAVREMSLPDACAELLLNDNDANSDRECGRSSASGSGGEWESPRMERSDHWVDQQPDCCRSRGSGSLRCASTSSLRSHLALESSRSSTCRRDMSPRPTDASHHRESTWSVGGEWSSCRTRSGGGGGTAGGQSVAQPGGRLSAAVPDVAMAPNANTHLLTARDYFRHAPPWEYSGGVNGVLQLDLGDGATHTPRPGSRAQRAAANRHSRDQNQLSTTRSRPDEDELRAAIELSVIRAYSSYQGQGQGRGSPPPAAPLAPTPRPRNASATLPTNHHQHRTHHAHGVSSRGSPSPSSLSASNSAHLSAPSAPPQSSSSSSSSHRHADMHTPDDHHNTLRVYATGVSGGSGLSGGGSGLSGGGSGLSGGGSAARRTSSPRRPHRDYTLYRHHDYRLDGNYGSSGSGSRGPSPNSYA